MLSDFQRGQIHAAHALKKNVAAIARLTGIHRATVKKYLAAGNQRVERHSRKPSKRIAARRAAAVKLTKHVVRKGSRTWPRYGSASQIAVKLREAHHDVSSRTVQRDLRISGLKSYVRRRVPTRRAPELAKRKAFGKELKRWTNAKLGKIVFTDESWLDTNERTGRTMWADCRSRVLPMERKCRWNVNSVMVFAGVGIGFKSEIIILPSKMTKDGEVKPFRLDSATYIRRCLSKLVPEVIRRGRVLQQDGARSHAAKQTMNYLKRKRVEVLEDWPAYSPDLNCIERVWHDLQQRVGARGPDTQEELIKVIKEEWAALPQKTINAHCRHFVHQVRDM